MGLNVVKAGSGPEAEGMMSLWKNLVDLFPAKEQTLLMLGSYTEVCACVCSHASCVCLCFSGGGQCMCLYWPVCLSAFTFDIHVHIYVCV